MIKLLELFGGIGAPREALERILNDTGIPLKSIDYVEILPSAVDAYNAMFDHRHKPQDIIDWNLNVDILVHGSPCQDWSKNGNNDINTGRSILYQATLDKIENHLNPRPKIVIWENVPNLVHRHRVHFDHYLEAMESFGYVNHWEIIDSKEYGLPQSRPRVKVVSIRADIEGAESYVFPVGDEPLDDIRQYIDHDVVFADYPLGNAEGEILTFEDGELYVNEAVKAGRSLVNEYDCINLEFPSSKTRRGRVGKQMTKTLLTTPRQAIYYDGQVRMLTSKEITRFMGFGDEVYQKLVDAGISDSRIKFLMGNSIAVPVMESIFKSLFDQGILTGGL